MKRSAMWPVRRRESVAPSRKKTLLAISAEEVAESLTLAAGATWRERAT
jgi:hypothetical protein